MRTCPITTVTTTMYQRSFINSEFVRFVRDKRQVSFDAHAVLQQFYRTKPRLDMLSKSFSFLVEFV